MQPQSLFKTLCRFNKIHQLQKTPPVVPQIENKQNEQPVITKPKKRVSLSNEYGMLNVAENENGKFEIEENGNDIYVYPTTDIKSGAMRNIYSPFFDYPKGDVNISEITPAHMYRNTASGRYELIEKGGYNENATIVPQQKSLPPIPSQNTMQTKPSPQSDVTLPIMNETQPQGQNLEQKPILPTKETIKAIDISKKLGVKAVVAELPEGVNGKYQNGIIVISSKSKDPAKQVLFHELTHHIETTGEYEGLKGHIVNHIAKMGIDIESVRQGIYEDYKANGVELSAQEIDNELVAKFVENKMFADDASIERLTRENTRLAQRIYEWISDTITKLTGTSEQKFLLEAQKKYASALKNAQGGDRVAMSQGKSFNDLSKQIETPEFKKWFGDSEVVDAEGKPLVVYHFTPQKNVNYFAEALSKNDGSEGAMSHLGLFLTRDEDFQGAYSSNSMVPLEFYVNPNGKNVKCI